MAAFPSKNLGTRKTRKGAENNNIKIYADTSVFGGVFDEEFAEPCRRFFSEIEDGPFKLVTATRGYSL